ncbi:MAG: hypothetical protein NZ937_05245 [Armatimonadetes bacterium]|nr:hypothetical protein [Armatimonadota bacterium]
MVELKRHEVDIKQDMERLFSGFLWSIKGFVEEEGNLYPIPEIPQLITGIFQEIAKEKKLKSSPVRLTSVKLCKVG